MVEALGRRRGPLAAAGGSLGLAVLVLIYQGPGRWFVRGLLGDVLVVVFLVACLASLPVGRPWQRVAGVGVFALGTECLQLLQLVGPDAPFMAHLILGSTFDPVDLLAYAVGLGVAVGLERRWSPPV